MRAAKARDWRRRARERPYPVALRAFEFKAVPAIGSGLLQVSGAPAVLCGGNGVGKTTILDAIFITLSPDVETLPERRLTRLEGAELHVHVVVEEEEKVYSARVQDGEVVREGEAPPFDTVLMDPGPQCQRWLAVLESMANVDELLEGFEGADSDEEELAEVSYLTGKDYDARRIYEISEQEGILDETIPYVSVEASGHRYEFGEMGLGELALNVLHWQLAHAPRGSLVLIEEPETFVSPRSQRCVVDVLCRHAVERSFFPVLTTHSWGIAGRLDIDRTVLIHGPSGGSRDIGIRQPPRLDELNNVLAVPRPPPTLLLVEDQAAELFGSALLDSVDSELLSFVEFCSVGDANTITQIIQRFPASDGLTLVGLYDGGFADLPNDANWAYALLPGARPPEGELRASLDGRLEVASKVVGRTGDDMRAALAGLAGADDHDWLTGLADRLNKSLGVVVAGLTEAWLEHGDNRESAQALAAEIRALSST